MTGQGSNDIRYESLSSLASCIEQSHHVLTRTELNLITDILDEIKCQRQVIAPAIKRCFMALQADLIPHMMKEELIVFPFIREMEHNPAHLKGACFGTVTNPLHAMQSGHEQVKELLEKLRNLTSHYTCPPESPPLMQAFYSALARLDDDLQQHIYLEDSVLFPRAIQLEEEILSRCD